MVIFSVQNQFWFTFFFNQTQKNSFTNYLKAFFVLFYRVNIV